MTQKNEKKYIHIYAGEKGAGKTKAILRQIFPSPRTLIVTGRIFELRHARALDYRAGPKWQKALFSPESIRFSSEDRFFLDLARNQEIDTIYFDSIPDFTSDQELSEGLLLKLAKLASHKNCQLKLRLELADHRGLEALVERMRGQWGFPSEDLLSFLLPAPCDRVLFLKVSTEALLRRLLRSGHIHSKDDRMTWNHEKKHTPGL